MKNIFKTAIVCLCTFGMLASCEKAEEGLVKVTHYAVFDVKGVDANGLTVSPAGSTFTDPGVVCKEGTEDVTSKVKIVSNVNANKPGVYAINYSVNNVDGFASNASRTVLIYNPDATDRDLSGVYTVADNSYRINTAGAKTPFSGFDIEIVKVAPGSYYISDYMGGYYDQRAGYGSAYAMEGYFSLNNDNTIDYHTADVAGWGDSADNVVASYDEATGAINLEVKYAGSLTFYVTLTK